MFGYKLSLKTAIYLILLVHNSFHCEIQFVLKLLTVFWKKPNKIVFKDP